MRTVAMIHQPHFLPWPGYVARCIAADVVVLLDNVRFKKGYFHNRTRYLTLGGRETWLTLPLAANSTSGIMAEVRLAPDFGILRWQRRFVEAYRRWPLFDRVWSAIGALIDRHCPSLLEINVATLKLTLGILSEALDRPLPRLVLASTMSPSSDRTGRLIDISHQQGIDHLLMGADALKAHDLERLETADLTLLRHVHRSALAGGDRVAAHPMPPAGVTTLHHVFQAGVAETAEALVADWAAVPLSSPTTKGN